MDFFPMDTLDEVRNTSVLYPLAFNAAVGGCVCVCGSGAESVVCTSRTLRMEKWHVDAAVVSLVKLLLKVRQCAVLPAAKRLPGR